MATRKDLSVEENPEVSTGPQDEPGTLDESKPKAKRLKKGWKDPTDIAARGRFKTPSGNIREDF